VSCTQENCDDGNPCTNDVCDKGTCIHENNTATCTDDGDECTADNCNGGTCTHPATGACECKSVEDCDDSNPCTDEVCTDNQCVYTNNTGPCPDDGNDCRDDICVSGTCQHPNKAANADCTDDGDDCTSDVCNGAVCTHPANGQCECDNAIDCNDNNPCTDEDCVNMQCMYTNNTGPCGADTSPCTDDVCANGTCTHPFNTGPCTPDASMCTNDVCGAQGLCTHITITCDDDNDCTTDTCVPATGCVFTNNTLACATDNDACTDDVCAGGVCTHDLSAMCDDNNPCTNDTCTNGVCGHTNNTLACATDNNVCTDDICAAGACTHPNNTDPCPDESPAFSCTDDVCAAGACTHVDNSTCECASAAQCDDTNTCTTDTCDGTGHCQHADVVGACGPADADSDQCTFDTCSAGVCTHPDNGACFADGGLMGTPFTINSFDSGTDWTNRVTTPDHRPMVVTGTVDNANIPDGGYIAVSSNLTIEMDVASMSGLLIMEFTFGAGTGTPAMVDVGVYNGTTWTDLPLGNYSTTPTTAFAAGTVLEVDTLDFGVPLSQITKVRIILKPTGGQKAFRLNNIAATN
jgi:hypothetical protein